MDIPQETQHPETSASPWRSDGITAAEQHEPFAISAQASLQDVRPLTLKHGDSFCVFDKNGDALSGPGSAQGLYYRDTRHLSHFSVVIDGAHPLLLSSTLRDDNATLTCDLTNPDLYDATGGLRIEHDLIHLGRSRFLWNARCFERLSVQNFDDGPRRIELGIIYAADFADLFEVRGKHRERRGETHPPQIRDSETILSYTGLDKRRRSTALRFDPSPAKLAAGKATYVLDLGPREGSLAFH
jgi:glycogen debranching enzyme